MVDRSGNSRVDPRSLVAGRDAVSPGSDNLVCFFGAGLRAAPGAAGTDKVRNVQSFGFRESRAANAVEDFFADFGNQLVQFRGCHFEYRRSISEIF
jgi:hypothetical protein